MLRPEGEQGIREGIGHGVGVGGIADEETTAGQARASNTGGSGPDGDGGASSPPAPRVQRIRPSGRLGAEARWTADHHNDQNGENNHVGPAYLMQLAAERLDQSDQQAAGDGTGDVANAAKHCRGKGAQPGGIADIVPGKA